jgi:hypothetical protein
MLSWQLRLLVSICLISSGPSPLECTGLDEKTKRSEFREIINTTNTLGAEEI